MAPGGGNNKKTHRVFGQATRYQRQFGGGSGKTHSRIRTAADDAQQQNDEETAAQRRRAARERAHQIETKALGVQPLAEGTTERGWLYNVVSTTVSIDGSSVFVVVSREIFVATYAHSTPSPHTLPLLA